MSECSTILISPIKTKAKACIGVVHLCLHRYSLSCILWRSIPDLNWRSPTWQVGEHSWLLRWTIIFFLILYDTVYIFPCMAHTCIHAYPLPHHRVVHEILCHHLWQILLGRHSYQSRIYTFYHYFFLRFLIYDNLNKQHHTFASLYKLIPRTFRLIQLPSRYQSFLQGWGNDQSLKQLDCFLHNQHRDCLSGETSVLKNFSPYDDIGQRFSYP